MRSAALESVSRTLRTAASKWSVNSPIRFVRASRRAWEAASLAARSRAWIMPSLNTLTAFAMAPISLRRSVSGTATSRLPRESSPMTPVMRAIGRVVDDYVDAIDPTPGREVQLSLDTKVQFFAYQRVRDAVAEHKAKAGSVVVIDVVTGEVLALANYPSFHPSMRAKLKQEDFGEAARNRALTDVFEPGSVMKPFVAAWALESGRVKPSSVLSTASFSVGGRPIHDTHPREQMTVTEIV